MADRTGPHADRNAETALFDLYKTIRVPAGGGCFTCDEVAALRVLHAFAAAVRRQEREAVLDLVFDRKQRARSARLMAGDRRDWDDAHEAECTFDALEGVERDIRARGEGGGDE